MSVKTKLWQKKTKMGKGRKRSFVRNFFIPVGKDSICKACNLQFVGDNATNLRRHMLAVHAELFNEELGKKDALGNDIREKKVAIKVIFSKKDIEDCLQFLVQQGQPLSFFDSDAFKCLTVQTFDGLHMTPIRSTNINELLHERYVSAKESIKNVVDGRKVSLKMDTATRHNKSILGINLQILENNIISVYTLDMIELLDRHTGDNLKKEVEKVLCDFNISKEQIYTVTTDNGRNMIKAVDLLALEDESEDEDSDNFDEEQNLPRFPLALSIKCAAHTLQLAIKSFLSENEVEVINSAQEVVKELRAPNLRRELIRCGLRAPLKDVCTRWGSMYSMLSSLLKCKKFCDIHIKKLSCEEWSKINGVVKTLAPVYQATLKLQKEQLLLGDFWKIWLNMKLELRAEKSALSDKLSKCISNIEPSLLDSDVLKSALFLDPRLRRTLSIEDKEKAKTHLKKLAQSIVKLKKKKMNGDSSSHLQLLRTSPLSELIQRENENANQQRGERFKEKNLLRDALRELEENSTDEDLINSDSDQLQDACIELEKYKESRIDIDVDVMEYWNEKKYMYPHLFQLAQVVHAVPATQVTVERAFSALRFILNERRCNLSNETMRKILFLKLNKN